MPGRPSRLLVLSLCLFLIEFPLATTVAQTGVWIQKTSPPSPGYGGYGEAVVGTGSYIYIIRGYSTGSCQFWRYNPASNSWTTLLTWTPDSPIPRPKSGTTLTWDHSNYVYALLGAAYADNGASSRYYFYRYSISGDSWVQLADTPHAQGAGDAATWSGYDNKIYAVLGSNTHGTGFARYSPATNTWETLPFNPSWSLADDGSSLVWSGGEYLYAMSGEWQETIPHNDFARYDVPTNNWAAMAPIPVSNGVGDGASLLWIGNWISEYHNYIFALGGNDVLESPGYDCYYYDTSNNKWTPLESIPYPVGYYDGNRLGFALGNIFYWQGAPSTWDGGGTQFCMFTGIPIQSTIALQVNGVGGDASGTIITVDNVGYSYSQLPVSFNWIAGTTHSIAASSPVSAGSGKQYIWTSWSDGGAQTHTYTVPSSSQTVTANFITQPTIFVPSSYLASNPLGRVFFVFNDKKYYITNPNAFTSYGFNWADVKTSPNPDSYQSSQIYYDYLLDGKMPLPNKAYIAGDVNDGSLYYIPYYTWSGEKYPISGPGFDNGYGGALKKLPIRYGDPAMSLVSSSIVLDGVNAIPSVTPPSYDIGKNPLGRVYFIFNGQKYYFTDWSIYLSYGFKDTDINQLVNPDLIPNAQVTFDYLLEDTTSIFRKPLPNQSYIVGDVNDGSLYWVPHFTWTGEKYPITGAGYNGYSGQLKTMHTRYGDPSINLPTSSYILDGSNPIPQLVS